MSQSLPQSRKLAFPLTRVLNSWLFPLVPLVPLPHRLVHGLFVRDNDLEQAENGWARLRNVSELGRYSAIRGLLQQFSAAGTVLDVGCGEGILQERIPYTRYLGIELFPAAVARASARSDARTRFQHADATTFVPDEKFDAIVWNECLYYLEKPLKTLDRYMAYLQPDGVVIVSMFYQTFATRQLFRELDRRAERLASVKVANEAGSRWLVNAYRPKLRSSGR